MTDRRSMLLVVGCATLLMVANIADAADPPITTISVKGNGGRSAMQKGQPTLILFAFFG
jgi:hypothetical protein